MKYGLPAEQERGDAFEVFAEAYLATQAITQAKQVFPFDAIPLPLSTKLGLDTEAIWGLMGFWKQALVNIKLTKLSSALGVLL